MILLFKLITTPVLICGLTLLSRRFGATVSGLLMGVPLVTGPISIFTALENGAPFAQHGAFASFVGQISTCLFCFCYAVTAKRLSCWSSAAVSIVAFLVATLVWNQISWTFAPALALLLASIILLLFLVKPIEVDVIARGTPRFDLLTRMVISTSFVLMMTLLTKQLGAQVSGLVAPFPVFVMILGVFTHHQKGAGAAANLMRGVILGSLSFAAFFTIVAAGLTGYGIPLTYTVAALASVAASIAVYLVTHHSRPAMRKR